MQRPQNGNIFEKFFSPTLENGAFGNCDRRRPVRRSIKGGVVPLIFVLFVLPPEEEFERWLEIDEEKLLLRKCAYWTPLGGFPVPQDQTSSTIYVPKENVLTPQATFEQIVVPLAERRNLTYETP